MQKEKWLGSNLKRKIGDAMNKEAKRAERTASTIPARLSRYAAEVPPSLP